MLALQQSADAFQPHAGIDRLHFQRNQTPIGELFVLHEDVVPNLDKTVAVLIGTAGGAAPDAFAMVKENLGAGATRAGRPHAPEIVVRCDADDAVVRKACDFLPIACGFFIGVIDGDAQLIFRDVEILGQQLPSERDRLFFEIIAERKVPQHLKERMVAGSVAHIVQIVVFTARAHRFLRRCGPFVIARLHAREAVLELHHA